jgi:hypothetical protein
LADKLQREKEESLKAIRCNGTKEAQAANELKKRELVITQLKDAAFKKQAISFASF